MMPMRTLTLFLLLACGAPVDGRDAGDPFHPPDGGSAFTCEPGANFCSASKVWSCTINGDDAVIRDTCREQRAGMQIQGACSIAPCDGGEQVGVTGGGAYCCYP